MRSLEEWHKYVELQEKRASTAKSAAAPPRSEPPEPLEPEHGEARQSEYQSNGHSSALDDLYTPAPAFDPQPPAREVEPLYLNPTPLPANIEFAADDLISRDDLLAQPSPSPPARPPAPRPALYRPVANAPLPVESAPASVSEPAVRHRVVRNSRAGNGARKETREELLARLLDPELTLEEAAQVLNVCPTTVRRYTNRGVLPHYRTIGNQRRFRLSQVLAFLESQDLLSRSQATRSEADEGGAVAPTEDEL